jgi:para-aminobenzoate synthetase / 4-amino-4-deoxychorismate lyase
MTTLPFIALHSEKPGEWLLFEKPHTVLSTTVISGVIPILDRVESEVKKGRYAAGFISYEAAPAFDRAFKVHPLPDFPLIWFGVFDKPLVSSLPDADGPIDNSISWLPSITENDYGKAILRIKDYIQAGDTYQVNFTFRMHASFNQDPWNYFRMMNRNHRMPFAAFIEIGPFSLCSFSPELLFRLDGDKICSQPMKGTALRGRFPAEDQKNMDLLHNSPKDQAENIMIVDMIRNDMGRIAQTSSIQVSDIYKAERFPTVLQMTTTVSARTQASMPDIFRALFPCASITGAPKIRTMQIINELEQSPRGIYCGSIGYFGPGRQARFSVAIRTICVDNNHHSAEYSIGSGVIWDSETTNEYQECLTKAEIVTKPLPDFSLYETLLWTPGEGFFLIDYHLRRMIDSAGYFGFDSDEASISKYLQSITKDFPGDKQQRIRLVLKWNGQLSHTVQDYVPSDTNQLKRLMISKIGVNSKDPFLFHKTTKREVYHKAMESCPGADDVVLWNERGEVTETSIANIVVESNGRLLTPKLECGLLPGTFRAELLEQGKITESIITVDSLKTYAKIFRINSIRKWEECELIN